jgi:hypothetical protein
VPGRSTSSLDAMETFAVLFPELLSEFAAELDAAENAYLANQLRLSAVRSVTYDADSDAAVIALESPRQLNSVERRVIGVRYEQSVPVSKTYSAQIDVDNFDRAMGVEILSPPSELRAKLRKLAASNRRLERP